MSRHFKITQEDVAALAAYAQGHTASTLYCPPFHPMPQYYPDSPVKINDQYSIEVFTIDAEGIARQQGGALQHGNIYDQESWSDLVEGDYVRLVEYVEKTEDSPHGFIIWMSDTPNERRTNLDILSNARGNVLIAGLGIGMLLPPLIQNPEVISVTVIEINQDLINAVAHRFAHPKLTVIHGDIFKWRPSPEMVYETIYFDIWEVTCADNLLGMNELVVEFAPYLTQDMGWVGCWNERVCLVMLETEMERAAQLRAIRQYLQEHQDELQALLQGMEAGVPIEVFIDVDPNQDGKGFGAGLTMTLVEKE